jgi:hypothetical protein
MASFVIVALRLGVALTASLGLAASPAVAALLNGGFELVAPDGSFVGWTTTGNGILADTQFPNSGTTDAAFIDTVGVMPPSTLSQTVATDPSASYTLAFALLDEAGQSTDSFSVSFGGFAQLLTGDQAAPPGNTPSFYTDFSFLIPGGAITGTATTLTFSGLVDPNNPTAWNLDDVSLAEQSVPMPEAPSGLILITSMLLAWTLRRRSVRASSRVRRSPAPSPFPPSR